MLSTIHRRKREIMGWAGLAGILIGLFFFKAPVELRIFLIAAGIGLVCLALPRSIWPRVRNWWTID
jgi:hypothetical protein